jgi:hypothetical protein
MYASLWRALPGPLWVKVIEATVIVVAIVLGLMAFVFPVLADVFLTEESRLGAP